MTERPFDFLLSSRNNVWEQSLPHFATEIPVGLKFTQVPEGVVLYDFKWPQRMSNFACSGSVDPRLFKRIIRFRLKKPPFMTDASLSFTNNSLKDQRISGILYTEPESVQDSFVMFMPIESIVKIGNTPWKIDLQPKLKAIFQGRTQLQGELNEVIIPEELIPLIEKRLLDITIEKASYLPPPRAAQLDERSRVKLGYTIDSGRIYITHPCKIDISEWLIVTFQNKDIEPIKGVTATSTLRIN